MRMKDSYERLGACQGFQWDKGNLTKSWLKHHVSPAEAEQVFFNMPFVVVDDPPHSGKEARYYALGRTDAGRALFVCFTIGGAQVCVISSRDMSRKEREVYRSHEKKGHS